MKGNEIDFNNQEYLETRILKNVKLTQKNNNFVFKKENLEKIVTKNNKLNFNEEIDLIISNITLKYTQSNSVCISYNGKVIGIGAGQQSRIDCVKLAKEKQNIFITE